MRQFVYCRGAVELALASSIDLPTVAHRRLLNMPTQIGNPLRAQKFYPVTKSLALSVDHPVGPLGPVQAPNWSRIVCHKLPAAPSIGARDLLRRKGEGLIGPLESHKVKRSYEKSGQTAIGIASFLIGRSEPSQGLSGGSGFIAMGHIKRPPKKKSYLSSPSPAYSGPT